MSKGFSVFIDKNQVQIKAFFEKKTYDSVFIDSDSVNILIEGIVLNKKNVIKKNVALDFEDFLLKTYKEKNWRLIQQLEGEFRGCIWDKKENKVLIFTNPTSTQRVFYSKMNDQIFIDADLVRLTETLKNKGISIRPDISAFYQLLTIGNLLENKTPIQNIYKILDSHFLEIDGNSLTVKEIEYFNISEIPYYNKNKKQAIDDLHEVFTEAVKMEYEKDLELNTPHVALLSGGLDSRMAMFYAIKNNLKPDLALCFSQSGYLDEKISRKIASDYDLNYEFIPLDKGIFLEKIDELTRISEGTSLYTGGIHVSYALDQLQLDNLSIFHGGQIGDGILGGFNLEPNKKAPSLKRIIVNEDFLPKIKSDLDNILKNYEKEEIFLLKNLAYNRTVLGAQVMQQKAYLISPFMTKDFINLSISFPENWKYKQKLYLEWLSKHCKDAEKYTWEKTLTKPGAQWKMRFGEKFLKNGYLFFYKKILKSPEKASMYPYQYYFDSSSEIQRYYQQYFNENIERLENYKELQNEMIELFSSKVFYQKSQAINILSIFKLYF